MFADRLLQITFIVSILAHGMFILPKANFNPFVPAPKVQKIVVRYIKENPQVKLAQQVSPNLIRQGLMPPGEPFLKLDPKVVTGNKRAPLPYIEPADTSVESKIILNKSLEFSKPIFARSEITAIKKRITLPSIEMAKIDNPSYISYYQIVREKIRRSAYQNYTYNETGEVYASFIISNDGYIKDVHLIDEKTTNNDYLKSVALRSVRDASPFPNFPKELDYPQLSFNIIISFEIE